MTDNPNPIPEQTENRRPGRRFAVITAVLATAIATAILTVLSLSAFGMLRGMDSGSTSMATLSFSDTKENRDAVDKLRFYLDTVKSDFREELTDAELIEMLVEGLPYALGDPYTMYLSPEEYQDQVDSLSGAYSGIGVVVHFTDEGDVVISEVLEGSPAEETGLLPGDRLTSVDGVSIDTFPDRDTLAGAVRGPTGTDVTIGYEREEDEPEQTVVVTRAEITNSSSNFRMLEDGIGYIHIKEFSRGVADEFFDAIEALADEGAEHYVLDLRFNLGGSADEVLAMLDYLLPEGPIAEVRGRADGEDIQYTWDSNAEMGVPEDTRYTILVNGYSASASELFAGCLREYDKAVLIGEQTFGKGTGTTTFQYTDGSALNMSFFRYYFPVSGTCIEGEGLVPDVPLVLDEEYRYLAVSLIPDGLDTQLIEGVRLLRAE